MNTGLATVYQKRIERTTAALERNNIKVLFAPTRADVVPIVKGLVNEGDTVAFGGSMTLVECGVKDYLATAGVRQVALDFSSQGEERKRQIAEVFTADVLFAGTNALTEEGELYNVDGIGNRVAPMIFGPDSVVLVVGRNKIVPTMQDAIARMRTVAAPANAIRLGRKTPCAVSGRCMDCHSEERICCAYTVLGQQRVKDRIKVILVDEDLGL